MKTALAALIVAALAAQDPVKAAEKALVSALSKQDKAGVESATKDLLTANTPAALKFLLTLAAKSPGVAEDPFWMDAYWTILGTAASFSNPAAVEELGEWILRNKARAISRDAMSMVSSRAQKELVPLCVKVLQEGTDDLRLLAADHLIAIGTKAAVEPLLKALKSHEKNPGDLKKKIVRGLTAITGQDYGESLTNWEGWWAANKDKELEESEDKRDSTGTVTDTFDRSRTSEYDKLKKTGKVLVLQAGDKCKCGKPHDLDQIDRITQAMGLTTETITKLDFEKRDDLKLSEYVAVLANCTFTQEHCACPLCKPSKIALAGTRAFQCECPKDQHDPVKYVLGDKGIRKLKQYVETGGYLFAEDWCMEEFVEKAFGDLVVHSSIQKEAKVQVLPKAGQATHPYLKKIFFKPGTISGGTVTESDLQKVAQVWKIDQDTRAIKIKDPARVTTLLTSPDLEKAAQGDDAVAITFAPGSKDGGKNDTATGMFLQDRAKMTGGRVLYVLSHFGKQESQDDEFTLQNLLINFLVEAHERRGTYGPPARK